MAAQEFSPAETQKAPEVIYSQIYQRIISGKLKPGDRLPSERVLSEQFQRSRHIIREALRMLQQDGLITVELGSTGGAIVQGISIEMLSSPLKRYVASGDLDVLELTEYRYLNDLGCARFAARHRTEEDIQSMREALDRVKASLDNEEAFLEHDVDFHRALAAASHNRLAIVVNDAVIRMSAKISAESIAGYSREQRLELNRRVYETHNNIFKAVVAQDVAEASRCADAVVNLFREQSILLDGRCQSTFEKSLEAFSAPLRECGRVPQVPAQPSSGPARQPIGARCQVRRYPLRFISLIAVSNPMSAQSSLKMMPNKKPAPWGGLSSFKSVGSFPSGSNPVWAAFSVKTCPRYIPRG